MGVTGIEAKPSGGGLTAKRFLIMALVVLVFGGALYAANRVVDQILRDVALRTADAMAATALALPDIDRVLAGDAASDRSISVLQAAERLETVVTFRIDDVDGMTRLFLASDPARADIYLVRAERPLVLDGVAIGTVAVEVDLREPHGRYLFIVYAAGFLFAALFVAAGALIWREAAARIRASDKASFLSSHDGLTGLPNRQTFRQLTASASVETGVHHGFALMLIDIQGLGAVNDALGHEAGDAALRALSDRMRAAIARHDVLSRLEGDRFGLLRMDAQTPEDVSGFADSLMTSLSAPIALGADMQRLNARIGVALMPEDAEEADALIGAAEVALRRAKTGGGAPICFFEAEMDSALQERRALERDIHHFVQKRGFELRYQPLVSLENREIKGFEALMRWPHPTRGFVSPAVFIPMAETTGAIHQLGVWALRQACNDALSWPQPWKVAVNTSPLQFGQDDFPATVARVLDETGLPPDRLEIEVTESILISNTERVLTSLRALKDFGVRVSMDDFGTGYSSLSYLWRFPFDKLKVDQAFVREMTDQGELRAIVGAIVAMAKALNMVVTAEGVETPQQLDTLTRLGCDEAQGYLLSAPLKCAELADFAKLYGVAKGTL